jgi:hypothetical protein
LRAQNATYKFNSAIWNAEPLQQHLVSARFEVPATAGPDLSDTVSAWRY